MRQFFRAYRNAWSRRPLSKSEMFSLVWMAVVVLFILTAPRGQASFGEGMAWIIAGTTVFSLVVLSLRWPMLGICIIGFIQGLCGWRSYYYPYYRGYRRWRRW
jgi:hypothetical protein